MNKAKFHTFSLGSHGKGTINMRDGSLMYSQELVAPEENELGIGITLFYDSKKKVDPISDTLYGQGFSIKLTPKYDADSSFYKNKASVQTMPLTGQITGVYDRRTGKSINFNYTFSGLDKIVNMDGKEIKFNKEVVMLTTTKIVGVIYPSGEEVMFNDFSSITDDSSATVMELDRTDGRITRATHCSVFDSIVNGNITGDNKTINSEFKFNYETRTTTKTDVKTGEKTVYQFQNDIGYTPATESAAWLDGVISETVYKDSVLQFTKGYKRTFVTDANKEVATTIFPENEFGDEHHLKTESVYNSDNDLVYEKTNGFARKSVTGKDTPHAKETRLQLSYWDKGKIKKITEELIDYNIVLTTVYDYNEDGELVKITDPYNLIKEKTIDPDDSSVEIWKTYPLNNPNFYIVNKNKLDNVGRTKQIIGNRGEVTQIEYVTGTGHISKLIDAEGNETSYGYYNNNLPKSISVGGLDDGNKFSYTAGVLTELSAPNSENPRTKFSFEYKNDNTSQYDIRQVVKIDNIPFVTADLKETKNTDGKVVKSKVISQYASSEKVEAETDTDGFVQVKYYEAGDQVGKVLITNNSDQKGLLRLNVDNLEGTTTEYKYDTFSRIAETKNEKIEQEFSYDNRERLSEVKYIIKELDELTQSYILDHHNRLESITFPNGEKEDISYDAFGVVKSVNGPTGYRFMNFSGSNITQLTDGGVSDVYDYDCRGNISKITHYVNSYPSSLIQFGYDKLNRLIREDNEKLNKTATYTYNDNGNILSKSEFEYAPNILTSNLKNGVTKVYTYSGDKMSKFDGQNCFYDELGNPHVYRGKILEWSHIRHLRKFDDVSFEYNASGIRTKKTVGKAITKFYYVGDKLLAENRCKAGVFATYVSGETFALDEPYCYPEGGISNQIIEYFYGATGIAGFKMGNETYYYRKNLMGDIMQIVDSNLNVKTEYVYDAWGSHKVYAIEGDEKIDITENILYNNIGHINPFRYRGYYFDSCTGLYYLMSRYYDPETGRFLNMDNINYLEPETINGLNLYAYCLNNPVMMINSTETIGVPSSGTSFNLRVGAMMPNYNFNSQLIANLPLANVVNRFSYTQSLIKNPFFAALIGNFSYTTTYQSQSQGWFYAYTDIGNGYVGYGVGINLGNVLGFEVGVTGGNFWDLGVNASISFKTFSVGGSIGTSGIGVNFGVATGNTTNTVGGTVGWGTVAFATVMALSPIPGGRVIAAFSLLFDWLF